MPEASALSHALYRADHRLACALPFGFLRRKSHRPIVTFTFDDVPRSAVTVGAAVLDQHNVSGTYYICGGLTGRSADGVTPGTEHHTRKDLEDLAQAGHDIGCHTFNHVSCWSTAPGKLMRELDENKAYLASCLGQDMALASFAYPFGFCGTLTKLVLGRRFPCARGTVPGMQHRHMDLSLLRAYRLYSSQTSTEDVSRLIHEAARTGAWLIFYTHDVTEKPSPYGCTPELLEAAVKEAQGAGCDVLSMRNGLGDAVFPSAA